jgi:hypothetical protein
VRHVPAAEREVLFVGAELGVVLRGFAYRPDFHEVGKVEFLFIPRNPMSGQAFRCNSPDLFLSLLPPVRGKGLGKIGEDF